MTHKSKKLSEGKTGALRVALLASLCTVALATTASVPVAFDNHGPTFKSAFAGNGNGGGNGGGNSGGGNSGGGNGKDDAPGQQKKLADDESAEEEEAVTSAVEGTVDFDETVAENGEVEQPMILPIAEDAEPANNKVIKELAGLPEDSALSDAEEQEAIRSGWGTWRTADGPETVISQ
jgi:hypothetical protein